jgi:hypothetical protein
MIDGRIVLCMKWGTLFPPDYVNVLYNACRASISGKFRFVCLTDDANGFVEGIEAFPIPDIGLAPEEWYTKGVWPKLALYVSDLHGLKGRCLFIDLDMVIVGGLDEMFEYSAGFVGIDVGESWRPGKEGVYPPELGTGVFAFNLGSQSQILEAFRADVAAAITRFRNEQDWVAAHADELEYWPTGWILSFKRHLRQPIGKDLFLPPKAPPASAKIVAYHGTPRPIDLVPERPGFWDRFPHLGRGQVSWVRDYWVENGGRMPPFE